MRSLGAAVLALFLLSSAWAAGGGPPEPPINLPPKIFVASSGSDSNDGGRATPKRSFQAAHDGVAAGGEIVVLDTAGYGPLVITKGVAVVVPPGVSGFVTVASGYGIRIFAGASDIVTLKGLIVEGPGQTNPSVTGIEAAQVGTLVIEDTTIRNFNEGIEFALATDGQLVVRGGAIRNVFDAVAVEGRNGAKTDAVISAVEMSGNARALTIAGNKTHVVVTQCVVSGSSFASFESYGTGAEIVVDGSTIAGNKAVFLAQQGGAIYTRLNNTIYNNGSLGTAPTPFAAQ